MACRLFDAKPGWYIVNWTLENRLQWNINGNSNIFVQMQCVNLWLTDRTDFGVTLTHIYVNEISHWFGWTSVVLLPFGPRNKLPGHLNKNTKMHSIKLTSTCRLQCGGYFSSRNVLKYLFWDRDRSHWYFKLCLDAARASPYRTGDGNVEITLARSHNHIQQRTQIN